MYEMLNYNIRGCEVDSNPSLREWIDIVMEDTCDCLNNFTEEDWKKLLEELPNKSTIWKKRFNDCLYDFESPYKIPALLIMANTDDEKLFIDVIKNLANCDLNNIENIDALNAKVEMMMAKASTDSNRSVLENFLKKKRI